MLNRCFGTMMISRIITNYGLLIVAAIIDVTHVNICFAPLKIAPSGVTNVVIILDHRLLLDA